MEFLGYLRDNGEAGIRNHVLVLPATRVCNLMAHRIADAVRGTTTIIHTGEYGRTKSDRERLARVLTGLARNPNVAAVLVLGVEDGYGYPEFQLDRFGAEISKSRKPMELMTAASVGGMHNAVERGIEVARKMVLDASRVRRQPVPAGMLTVGLKCGDSDPTSGIAGNPTLGNAMDRLLDHNGTVIFSETLEIVGAEEILAARAATPDVAKRLLDKVTEIEEKAKAVGEDIRTINPIPENVKAGITTLEEKSLGAIAKAGTHRLMGVLDYCRRPEGKGLYFMDAWMSSYSLVMSLAAAGAQLVIFQLGGGDLPENDPPLACINPGIVAPLMQITGNPRTWERCSNDLDFSSGGVLLGQETLERAGERLFEKILSVASGEMTKGETINFVEPTEVYYEGPFL